jgi:hypothetical protein
VLLVELIVVTGIAEYLLRGSHVRLTDGGAEIQVQEIVSRRAGWRTDGNQCEY